MVNTVEQEVPEAHEAPFKVPVCKYLICVYLLVRDQLEKLSSFELHLLLEIVVVQISNVAAVHARVLTAFDAVAIFVLEEIIFVFLDGFTIECLRDTFLRLHSL